MGVWTHLFPRCFTLATGSHECPFRRNGRKKEREKWLEYSCPGLYECFPFDINTTNYPNPSGLPGSLPNANQCRSKHRHWSEIPLNVNHYWSMPIVIDRHWLEIIVIERYFGSMPGFWSALIGIDWGDPDLRIKRFGKNSATATWWSVKEVEAFNLRKVLGLWRIKKTKSKIYNFFVYDRQPGGIYMYRILSLSKFINTISLVLLLICVTISFSLESLLIYCKAQTHPTLT